ncbi:MAG: YdcF family protein [Bacteroidales bacterium]|nr:YdcF family protein [Bacteroidales bacterium]
MAAKLYIVRLFYRFLKILRIIFIIFGLVFVFLIGLSLTEQPYWISYYLATANSAVQAEPDYIVMMGAGGMPGPKSLLRCYYTAQEAKKYPNAKIIVAMPAGPGRFLGSDPYEMYQEIARRGISKNRFMFEARGTNTHTQACNIFEMLHTQLKNNLLIITSPEHMYRSILSFEKCGFQNVDGVASFGTAIDNHLLLTPGEVESDQVSMSRNISLRYNMWNYLKVEIEIIREIVALSYYKVKGYI